MACHAGASMTIAARPRRVGNAARTAILVVVAVASFVLVADVARQGIDATRDLLQPDSIAATQAHFDTIRCVQAKIDRRIPPGAAIAVRSSDPLWFERSGEGSYPRYRVTTAAKAAYLVTVTSRGPTCDLVDVDVRRTR